MAGYKVNPQQMGDIAILLNGGVPGKVLARKYNVPNSLVDEISGSKDLWIPETDITTTPQQQFLYAQRVYRYLGKDRDKFRIGSSSFDIRTNIEDIVFGSVVRKVVQNCNQEPKEISYDPEIAVFQNAYFAIRPTERRSYPSIVRRISSEILNNKIMLEENYNSIDDAVKSIGEAVTSDETTVIVGVDDKDLTPKQREWKNDLKSRILGVAEELPDGQRNVVELRYGFDDRVPHNQEEVGSSIGISASGVSRQERQALRRFRRSQEVRNIIPDYLLRDLHWF